MRCLACDYDLRSLPKGRCPECRAEFDPALPGTWHDGRPTPGWAAWWVRPMPWWLGLAMLVPVAWMMPWLVDPESLYFRPFVALIVAILVLGPLVLVWVLREGNRALTRKRWCPHRRLESEARPWLVAIGIVVLVAVLQGSGLLVIGHFALFGSRIEALRQSTAPGTTGQTNAGLWRITGEWVDLQPGRRVFVAYTSGGRFPAGGSGFVWIPDGETMPGYNRGDDGPVGGGWRWYTTE